MGFGVRLAPASSPQAGLYTDWATSVPEEGNRRGEKVRKWKGDRPKILKENRWAGRTVGKKTVSWFSSVIPDGCPYCPKEVTTSHARKEWLGHMPMWNTGKTKMFISLPHHESYYTTRYILGNRLPQRSRVEQLRTQLATSLKVKQASTCHLRLHVNSVLRPAPARQ